MERALLDTHSMMLLHKLTTQNFLRFRKICVSKLTCKIISLLKRSWLQGQILEAFRRIQTLSVDRVAVISPM